MLLDLDIVQSLACELDFLFFRAVFDTPKLHLRAKLKVIWEPYLVDQSGPLVDQEIKGHIITEILFETSLKLW